MKGAWTVSAAMVAMILIAGSAHVSLDSMSRIQDRAAARSLRQFQPITVINFPSLLSQQEHAMPESIEPMKHRPPVVSPPERRTMPTPQRSRRTLPDRSLERRTLPQTE